MDDLPSDREVSGWLRRNVRKDPPGRIARWLGEPASFTYQVGRPSRRQSVFFRRHGLFHVHGETGLLPFVSLPHGSWGIFATDGRELTLLRPDDGSLDELLRREGRALDDAPAGELAGLICDVRLGRKPAHQHVVLASVAELRDGQFGGFGANEAYAVDEAELERVGAAVVPPTLEPDPAGGWWLRCTTLWGWMHELQELGVEDVRISKDFAISAEERRVLSKRIFRRVPGVQY